MARLDMSNLFNPIQGIIALADGNPGAVSALATLMQTSEDTDPENAFGSMSPIISLDEMEVYGWQIWVLFKDVCEQDPVKTLAVLRARQLGILSKEEILDGLTESFHSPEKDALRTKVTDIVAKVQAELPSFAQQEA